MSHTNHPEPVAAIVVAAGSGVRLGGDVPKALRLLDGRPLVSWSLDAMAAGGATSAVLVVAAGAESLYDEVVAESAIPVTVVTGGSVRQESVANGLAAVPGEAGIVLVHDAARPLVPPRVVADVVGAVRAGSAAVVPVVAVTDTIRQLVDGGSVVVDRSTLRAVQTPQGFVRETLAAAHQVAVGTEYTDDAAVCEAYGVTVDLVPGSPEAMKVTHATDLVLAEAILASRG